MVLYKTIMNTVSIFFPNVPAGFFLTHDSWAMATMMGWAGDRVFQGNGVQKSGFP